MAKKQGSTTRQKQKIARWRWGRIGAAVVLALTALLVLVGMIASEFLSDLWPFGADETQSITNPEAPLASFYAPQVLRWQPDIEAWADQYDVNPNVLAIVIQIESCGDPTAISHAGALGLMQVMPFHFADGENMLNPDTNVQRGMSVFYECLTQYADWDLGLALACYNGGPSVTRRSYDTWAAETQFYYRWATGLWADVVNKNETSETLSEWLDAGGQMLCGSAAG